ncbi:hypothetical protein E8E11_011407 [Didymella keratinophila]|nr:hypothetical protein E8E11_011407 [Didymella keratinophila]
MKSISESKILDDYPGFASAHLAEPPDTQGSLVLLMAPPGDWNHPSEGLEGVPNVSTSDALPEERLVAPIPSVVVTDTARGARTAVQPRPSSPQVYGLYRGMRDERERMFGRSILIEPAPSRAANAAVISETSGPQADHQNETNHAELRVLSLIGSMLWISLDQPNENPQLDYALIRALPGQLPADLASWPELIKEDSGKVGMPNYVHKQRFGELSGRKVYISVQVIQAIQGVNFRTIEGHINTTPCLMRGFGAKAFQELFTVTFSCALTRGISGFWVRCLDDQSIIGHIVAGTERGNIAYIVPAYQVFDDIRRLVSQRESLFKPRISDYQRRQSVTAAEAPPTSRSPVPGATALTPAPQSAHQGLIGDVPVLGQTIVSARRPTRRAAELRPFYPTSAPLSPVSSILFHPSFSSDTPHVSAPPVVPLNAPYSYSYESSYITGYPDSDQESNRSSVAEIHLEPVASSEEIPAETATPRESTPQSASRPQRTVTETSLTTSQGPATPTSVTIPQRLATPQRENIQRDKDPSVLRRLFNFGRVKKLSRQTPSQARENTPVYPAYNIPAPTGPR